MKLASDALCIRSLLTLLGETESLGRLDQIEEADTEESKAGRLNIVMHESDRPWRPN